MPNEITNCDYAIIIMYYACNESFHTSQIPEKIW